MGTVIDMMNDGSDVGSRLIATFRETFSEQVQKALARRIHAKVRDARSDPQVWRDVLSAAATELSQLPLVSTVRKGMLPGVQNEAHDRWVDFISRKPSGPSHVELWELAASCTEADPAMREDSEGWSEIAEGWEALSVSIPWMSLKEIGERAAHEVDGIAELAVDGPPHDWLRAR